MSAVTESGLQSEAQNPNYEIRPKVSSTGEISGDLLEVAMGPHHPSTHGVFRMDVVLDGERQGRIERVEGEPNAEVCVSLDAPAVRALILKALFGWVEMAGA